MRARRHVLWFIATFLAVSPVPAAGGTADGGGTFQLRETAARAYDFEEGRYVPADDVSADVTLPGTASELTALNGTLIANIGQADFDRVSRVRFESAVFRERADTAASPGGSPEKGAVFLAITGEGTLVKILLSGCAPGADPALDFSYRTISGTKADRRPAPARAKSAGTGAVPGKRK